MDYMQAWTPSLIENHISRREAQYAKISNNWKQNCCWNFDKLVLSLSLDDSGNLNLNLNSEKISLCIFQSVYILHFHFAAAAVATKMCWDFLQGQNPTGTCWVLRFLRGWDRMPPSNPQTSQHRGRPAAEKLPRFLAEFDPAALLRNVFRHWGQKKRNDLDIKFVLEVDGCWERSKDKWLAEFYRILPHIQVKT